MEVKDRLKDFYHLLEDMRTEDDIEEEEEEEEEEDGLEWDAESESDS